MEELRNLINEILAIPKEVLNSYSPEQKAKLKDFLNRAKAKLQTTQIPQGAEYLYALAGGNLNAFRNYASQFPNAAFNAMARNPASLANIYNQLHNRITMPQGEVSEGIPKAELQSSNVYGYQYDPRSKSLRVKFNGKDVQGDGPIYQYDGVPPFVFKMIAAGAIPAKTDGSNKWGMWFRGKMPSLGASVNELLKIAGFPYKKIS